VLRIQQQQQQYLFAVSGLSPERATAHQAGSLSKPHTF